MMKLSFTLENIGEAATRFWEITKGKNTFAFHGAMGSGKTTFIHALCEVKKVTSHVGSPTFSIINEYVYEGGKIFHIDLYRLKDENEAIRAGVEDCLYSGAICLVEWADKAPGLFPEDAVTVFIEADDQNLRHLTLIHKQFPQ